MKSKRQKVWPGTPCKKKSKKVPVLQAESKSTGIVHFFGDPEQWSKAIKDYELNYQSRQKSQLITSQSFDSFMKTKKLQTIPDFTVSGDIDIWSVAGSLADGGRFNVGGSQLNPVLSHLSKFAALYVASDVACAQAEAVKPLGKAKTYRLTPKKDFVLWDLEKVITELNHPSLRDQIAATPTDALWGYQKVPLVSQILSFYLRALGGNGIAFPSVKVPSTLNIALFFASDADAMASFEIEEVG